MNTKYIKELQPGDWFEHPKDGRLFYIETPSRDGFSALALGHWGRLARLFHRDLIVKVQPPLVITEAGLITDAFPG